MKFVHMADCHIGAWRDPLLSELNLTVFERAVDKIIEEKADFALISGDLFNTSLPGIDKLKIVAKKMKELKDNGIPIYMIAGSHDYSPSGKTMLDVLENAGLIVNVAKARIVDDKLSLVYTIDEKTGAKITGILGKMGGLEKSYYENLSLDDDVTGYKIFLFHTLLSELKPSEMDKVDSQPISLLPKNFNYYAGGHPHFRYAEHIEGFGMVCYPGPLFPNSFKELEELSCGGFYVVENGTPKFMQIEIHPVEKIFVNCENSNPEKASEELRQKISEKDVGGKIVTIRLSGVLESGRPSDIDLKSSIQELMQEGAFTVLKNTLGLSSKEFEDVKIEGSTSEEIEKKIISESIDEGMILITENLMHSLNNEKKEGETQATFEKRIIDEINIVLGY